MVGWWSIPLNSKNVTLRFQMERIAIGLKFEQIKEGVTQTTVIA